MNKGGKTQKLFGHQLPLKIQIIINYYMLKILLHQMTVNTVPEDLYNEIVNNEINYSSFKIYKNHYDDSEIIETDQLNKITDELLEVGIKLFEDAFDALIQEIKNKIS